MSKKPKPEKFERTQQNDSIAGTRSRSPSAVNFDGNATWSPSNFRKTVDITKMFAKSTVESGKLDKLLEESSKSPLSFPALVGSKEYADVIFHVGSHAIYAHRCVLESRCPPLFNVAIKDRGKKGHIQTLKTDDKLVDIRSLTLVLEYLYTGSVPFSDITPAEVISLIAHTELYQIDRLRWLCERYLHTVLNHDLFFSLLLVSDVAGVARAKKMCLTYGAIHFEALIVMKEKVHTLGIELFREFVVHSTLNHDVVEDLNQMQFPNTIREEFKIIFTAMANPDAFFVFKSSNTTVPCHKAVLYAQSERFKTLFLEDGPSAADSRYTLPKNISMPHEAYKSFLSWAYYRDTSFSAAHAAMMLPLAHDFGIDALVAECSGKLRKGITIDSVLPILSLCYSEWGKKGYKGELAQPCLDFLILNFAHVDLSGLKSASIAAAIASSIRDAVTNGIWKSIDPADRPASSSAAPSSDVDDSDLHSSAPISAATASASAPHDADKPNGHTHTPSQDDDTSASATAESAEDKKSARRKKRRTQQIDLDQIPEDTGKSTSSIDSSRRKSHHKSSSQAVEAIAEPTAAAVAVAATSIAESAVVEEKVEKVEKAPEPAPAETAQEKAPETNQPVETPVVEKPVEKVEEKVEKPKSPAKPAEEPKPTAKVAKSGSSAEIKVKAGEKVVPAVKSDSKSKLDSSSSGTPPASPVAKRAKAAATPSAEGEKAQSSSSEQKEISTSTKERRGTLEPSTSVKAIKETFEAKGREETEKEAASNEKLRAGRRTKASDGDLKSSTESTKKESKSK